jgi:DNA-binding beta-propeller fold protein YncE
VSPDGAEVVVAGSDTVRRTGARGYATVAYKASTGAQLWVARYNNGLGPSAVGFSVHGSEVFVTGPAFSGAIATIAYNAATGARIWVSTWRAGADESASPTGLAVSPDNTKVFVTGAAGSYRHSGYVTVAYDARSGNRLWLRRYNSVEDRHDGANAIAVSPDSSNVFVTGKSWGGVTGYDIATLRYAA